MYPPMHVIRALEKVNPNVRLGWTHKKEFADVPMDGAFALLDLYPSNCMSGSPQFCLRRGSCALHTMEPIWDRFGPIYGSKYDETRTPVLKKFCRPHIVFNGEIIGVVQFMSMTDREFAEAIIEQNAALEKQRKDSIKDLAGEMGQELYWEAQNSTEAGPTIANKHITKTEKEKVSGDWRQHVPESKPIGVSGLGLT